MVLPSLPTPRVQQPRVHDACRPVSMSVMLAAPPSRLASTILFAPAPPLPLPRLTPMPRMLSISPPPLDMHVWNPARTSSHNNTVESRATTGHPSRSHVSCHQGLPHLMWLLLVGSLRGRLVGLELRRRGRCTAVVTLATVLPAQHAMCRDSRSPDS
jgi:hypothetical protein